MITLALEFSSAQRSVAIARNGEVLASAAETGDPRVTNAFSLIEKVLAQAKVSREEIEQIAVGLGPGSYTGVRAAIALAQGWQLARGVKLIGVSSAEAIAARAQAEGILGRVNVVIDAQRGEFYLAVWDIFAASPDTQRVEVSALKIVSTAEIATLTQKRESCVGPAAEKVLYPDAVTVAKLATTPSKSIPEAQLEPIYLRETTFVKAQKPENSFQVGQ